MTNTFFTPMPVLFLAASVFSLPSYLFAQEQNAADVERIAVYGSFRETNLAQLDASASVINADTVSQRQASHFDDILNIAPNVNFTTGASRGRFVQIRGIGERSQFAEPINPSVSIVVDTFDFSGLGASGLLFDTQQVEVFRGPQATLFGSGALAGAINIQSIAPSYDAEGFVDLQIGTKSVSRIEAGYGRGISDSAKFRVAVLQNKTDGFIENTFLQRDDTNNLDESAAKAHLVFDISDITTLGVQYRWYDIDNGYDAFSLDNDNQTRSDQPGFDRQQTHALSAELNHQTSLFDLVIQLTTANHDLDYAYDEDWTFTGFHPFGYTSFDRYTRDISSQTGEVRIISNKDSRLFSDSTDWVAGFYAKTTDESLIRQYTFSANDFASEYQPDITAFYLQSESTLRDNWQLNTGIRVERFAFDYAHNEGLSTNKSTTAVGGKITLNYLMDSHFIYASISRGYKAAGVNPDQRVIDERRFFDTEYNWNYELGIKSFFSDIGLTSRFALFHMRRKNTQVSDFDVQIRDDGTADFIDIISNADLGTNEGIEAELMWQPNDNITINANIGYLNASFEGFTRSNGEFVDKAQQAQAPRWSGYLSGAYQITDAFSWNINMDVKDDFRFSDGHNVTSTFTTLVNSEVAYEFKDIRLGFWVKNLFDREYYTRGFGGFSNDPRDEYAFEEPYFQIGNERQFGVSMRYEFY